MHRSWHFNFLLFALSLLLDETHALSLGVRLGGHALGDLQTGAEMPVVCVQQRAAGGVSSSLTVAVLPAAIENFAVPIVVICKRLCLPFRATLMD